MKKVLVTGGFGRVGSAVIPMLLANGFQVRVLDIQDRPVDYHDQVEIVIGSLTDYDCVYRAVHDVDIVCHLAALFPPLFFEEAPIIETNVLGTFNILQAMKNSGTGKRLVFASTDATYATGGSMDTYSRPLQETDPLWPINVYGVTKVVNEVTIEKYSRLFGIPYTILRFFWSMRSDEMIRLMFEAHVYMDDIVPEDKENLGPDDIVDVRCEDGTPFRDHITDHRDIAQGVFKAIIHEDIKNEIFNIAAPDLVDYSVYSPKVARALNRDLRTVRVKGLKNYQADISKACKLLDYSPQHSMEEMVDEAIQAVQNHR